MNTKMIKNNNGFTLIEIIVVLVILAILAAASIPTMIGFVEDARGKAFIQEARIGYIAAQAVATEMIARGEEIPNGAVAAIKDSETFKNMTAGLTAKVNNEWEGFADPVISDGKIIRMDYLVIVGGKTYSITLEAGKVATVKKGTIKPPQP